MVCKKIKAQILEAQAVVAGDVWLVLLVLVLEYHLVKEVIGQVVTVVVIIVQVVLMVTIFGKPAVAQLRVVVVDLTTRVAAGAAGVLQEALVIVLAVQEDEQFH